MAFHVTTAFAASAEKQITVLMGGIRVFVDGVQVNATDNAGKPLEPIIYNGTTYLPVKAVADALQMPIKWNCNTRSIHYKGILISSPSQKDGGRMTVLTNRKYML